VLEEMGESGPTLSLVLRTDGVPEVDRYDGNRTVHGEVHPKAVLEAMSFNGYVQHLSDSTEVSITVRRDPVVKDVP
jgi:hypothetical protein